MEYATLRAMQSFASAPEALERTVSYLAENMSRFVRPQDKVLICFPMGGAASLGALFEQATLKLSGIPLFWSSDHKWMTLLRQSFYSRASVIIGPPLVVLGLSKLAKATATPLNIRHVVTAGYPCLDWMIEGIIRGLDCRTWGCFGPGTGAIVSGFSCGQSLGVHLREDEYDVQILNGEGTSVEDGESGVITLGHKNDPQNRIRLRDHGRLDRSVCACGQNSPRLVDIHPALRFQDDVLALYQQFHSWTSILDCRVVKGAYGLELELVVFPGEKLPKLPTSAKQVIRPWDPERDMPMDLNPEFRDGMTGAM